MNPADLLRAYVDAVWALAVHAGLLCALAALGIAGLAWACHQGSRRREPAATSENPPADLAAGCERLRAAIREAQTPGSDAWLDELYHAPAARRRNTR